MYIKCEKCKYWNLNQRYENICQRCNNTQQVISPNEIICNLCGDPSILDKYQDIYGLHNATVTGNYESYHLFDSVTYIFNFCEKCLRQLFIQCQVKPKILGYNSWEQEFEAYEYRLWIDAGGHHQAYLNGVCNAIKNCPNKAIYSLFNDEVFSEECRCEEHIDYFVSRNSKLVDFIPNNLRSLL